ncbi:hypothetical protein F5884DRAFT_37352 [Xylogone sp. PMI_703]|nr:hypothetical protein F5884DRAFT_37352 [Xylogone sp. PMI_703]
MDAFVSRKRRRITTPSPDSADSESAAHTAHGDGDEESTDFKLALLSSLYPRMAQDALLDILLAHEGDVDKTAEALKNDASPRKRSSTSAAIGYQSSLSAFSQPSLSIDSLSPKKRKLLSKKGQTLHLYTPEDVAAHTPCTIIHNFLPPEDANALLEELLAESETFEKITFKLFDNVVQSPHTSCFYVESLEEQARQKSEYIYNGGLLTDVRQLTPQMRYISTRVTEAVNSEVQNRIKSHYPDGKKLKYQSPLPWSPNAAFVNCYTGAAESVGYHSDQLTYLGPRAIIGSISLGVAREFRVRRIVPSDESSTSKSKEASDAQGQIAIHLPHNSLLVMHAEMQEEWKHSIAPAKSIDPHPIAGNKRINITYRNYKASLHPKLTPKCDCGLPCILRAVQKKKENWGKYFWMCYAGNSAEREDGCEFFQWAEFDDDGNPIWRKKKLTSKKD